MTNIKKRLEYLRGEIEAERISTEEIAELQGLAEHIDPSDTLLLERAGVEEFPRKKSVIVNINIKIKTDCTTEYEALLFAENYELPKEYVEDSYEVVKVIDED
jgi:hypothetical protein